MLSLFEGACRIVSGQIGKRLPQNDLVSTPIAIIGIRGTDHEVAIIPAGSAAYPAGVYDKVNMGVTYIKTEQGTIDIHPNQVGFAASQQELPRLLVNMPAFYNTLSAAPSSSRNGRDKAERGESGAEGSLKQPRTVPEAEGRIESDAVWGESALPDADTRQPPALQSLPELSAAGVCRARRPR